MDTNNVDISNVNSDIFKELNLKGKWIYQKIFNFSIFCK